MQMMQLDVNSMLCLSLILSVLRSRGSGRQRVVARFKNEKFTRLESGYGIEVEIVMAAAWRT